MRYVINKSWSFFTIPESVSKELSTNEWCPEWNSPIRKDERLIEMLINHPERFSEESVAIVNVPDEATDILVVNYDGSETLYYVLNGKIIEACHEYFVSDGKAEKEVHSTNISSLIERLQRRRINETD